MLKLKKVLIGNYDIKLERVEVFTNEKDTRPRIHYAITLKDVEGEVYTGTGNKPEYAFDAVINDRDDAINKKYSEKCKALFKRQMEACTQKTK